MNKTCDNCIYQEKRYDGEMICEHRQSMYGLEAVEEYVICDEIKECEFKEIT